MPAETAGKRRFRRKRHRPAINGAVEAIRDRYAVGSAELAQVIAIALIGCAVGAATTGRIADRIGRIRCMQIAALLVAYYVTIRPGQ